MRNMVRVLQLIANRPDSSSTYQIDLLSSGLSPDIEVCHFPLDHASARYHLFTNRIRNRISPPAVVHAFDWGGLKLAIAATGCPIVYSIQALHSAGRVRALGRLGRLAKRVIFVCSTSVQKRLLGRAGIASNRCHVIEPAVTAVNASYPRRLQIRQSLGLVDRDVVAFAPGDSTPTARHRLSLWAISILHVYDRGYRLLISGTGAQASALRRLADKLKQPAVLVSASERAGRPVDQSELMAAADVVLATDSLAGSPLPMALCMDAGLPLIGDANGLAGHYISEDAGTLLIRSPSPKLLARHILQSFPIGASRPGQSGARRPGAAERFDPARFRRQICDLYRAIGNGSR